MQDDFTHKGGSANAQRVINSTMHACMTLPVMTRVKPSALLCYLALSNAGQFYSSTELSAAGPEWVNQTICPCVLCL